MTSLVLFSAWHESDSKIGKTIPQTREQGLKWLQILPILQHFVGHVFGVF